MPQPLETQRDPVNPARVIVTFDAPVGDDVVMHLHEAALKLWGPATVTGTWGSVPRPTDGGQP
mgnify:CR=1 FL=1